MDLNEFRAMLDRFTADDWIEKNEIHEMRLWLAEKTVGLEDLGALKNYATGYFQDRLARLDVNKLNRETAGKLLAGQGRVLDALWKFSHAESYREHKAVTHRSESHFGQPGPQGDLAAVLIRELNRCRTTLDAAIYTVTNDRISDAILDLIRAGDGRVKARILTEDENLSARGSDMDRLARAKHVHARMDAVQALMHHKFVVIDGKTLVNGSFNWTRTASNENFENIVITDNPALVAAFSKEFESIWKDGRDL